MDWEWSKANEKELVKFVREDVTQLIRLPDNDRLKLRQTPSGRRKLIRDIYETLVQEGIHYDCESYQWNEAIQRIRYPSVILGNPGVGTCLDLAILFCGLCFGYELLPVLIILDSHALVAVSLNFIKRQWNDYNKERSLFKTNDSFKNLEQLHELVNNGCYLAIECTGFAKTQSFEGLQEPEAIGRDSEGFLPFERAIEAGKEQLRSSNRKFQYAIDIAVGQYYWNIKAIESPSLLEFVSCVSLARMTKVHEISLPSLKFKSGELREILEGIDFNLVKSVYRESLPEGAITDSPNLNNPSNLEELIEVLTDQFPKNQKVNTTILDFVLNLIKRLSDNNLVKNTLHQWVKDVVNHNKLNITIPGLKALQATQNHKVLCSFLQIIVEPIPQADDERFLLKAGFIEDYQDNKDPKIVPIDHEWLEAQKINCEIVFKDLSKSINEIIKSVFNEYLLGKKFNLTVEIFLTIPYLSKEIDLEEVPDDFGRSQPIGRQYSLVIRSYERICFAKPLSSFKQRWKTFNSKIQNNTSSEEWQREFIAPNELIKKQWDKLERHLTKENRIGLKISSNYPTIQREQEKLFTAILSGGVPICLWNRNRSLQKAEIDKLDQLLSLENLRELNQFYQAVLELRRDAHAQGKQAKKHIGYHLGLLCDHGERIPNIERLTRMV